MHQKETHHHIWSKGEVFLSYYMYQTKYLSFLDFQWKEEDITMWLDRVNHPHFLCPLVNCRHWILSYFEDFGDLLKTGKHLGCSDRGRVHYFRNIVYGDVAMEWERIIYAELERCAVNRTEQNRTSWKMERMWVMSISFYQLPTLF